MSVDRRNRFKHRVNQYGERKKSSQGKQEQPFCNIPYNVMQFELVKYLRQQSWNALTRVCKRFSSLEPLHVRCDGEDLDEILHRYSFITHLKVDMLDVPMPSLSNYKGLEFLYIVIGTLYKLPDCPSVTVVMCEVAPSFMFNSTTTTLRLANVDLVDGCFKNCQNVEKLDIRGVHSMTDAALDYMPSITDLTFGTECEDMKQNFSALVKLETVEFVRHQWQFISQTTPTIPTDNVKTVTFRHCTTTRTFPATFSNATDMRFIRCSVPGWPVLDGHSHNKLKHFTVDRCDNMTADEIREINAKEELGLLTINGMPVA